MLKYDNDMTTLNSSQLPYTAFTTTINNHQHLTSEVSQENQQSKITGISQSNQSTTGSSTKSLSAAEQIAVLLSKTNPLTPSSFADSGDVDDSKSENGNMTQVQLPSADDGVQDERTNTSASTVHVSTNGIVSSSSYSALCAANILGLQEQSTKTSNEKLQELAYSNSSTKKCNVQLSSSDNNCVPMSEELAAIWSPPTAMTEPSLATSSSIEEVLLQSRQQKQQLNGLVNSYSNSTGATRVLNPPPGLDTVPNLQKHLNEHSLGTAQGNIFHSKHLLRRSQSAMFDRPTMLGCATLPDFSSDDLTNSTAAALSTSLQFSPWTSGRLSVGGSSSSHSITSSSANLKLKLQSGSVANTKSVLSNQMPFPPKFHRSISTPAKQSSSFNLSGLMSSLDDNPFMTSHFASAAPDMQQTNIGYENSLNLTDLESKLSNIITANNVLQQGYTHQPHRVLGKWKELSNDTIFEEGQFVPSLPALNPRLGELAYERFSRKVFVGGLPPDIAEEEIRATFLRFGRLNVDWPHKAESKSYFPPKGYAFLLFEEELSVHNLVRSCFKDRDKLYIAVSSPTTREKPVQIRPWRIADSDYVMDRSQTLDPRKTVFVGGVPRPLRAFELALLMDRAYGGVCYAGIDVDPDLKYPKGAGRVAFSNEFSYKTAISARFVHLQLGDIDKRVEVKPYVLDDQHCDECHGARCSGKFAPFFCANLTCLRYYCDQCWLLIHTQPGYDQHKPMVKEGAERFVKSMFSR